MRVAILHTDVTAASGPDDLDTLVQAEAIDASLRRLGHQTQRVAFSLDLARVATALRRQRVELVFNLVESVEGQGRLIHLAPALLAHLSLPCSGASAQAMFLTTAKPLAKRLMLAHGIPTPPWWSGSMWPPDAAVGARRFVIKSAWDDASLGLDDDAVVSASDEAALTAELSRRAPRLGGEAFAEVYVDGREFNLSLLAGPNGPQVLPPAEIRFVDYPAGRPRLVDYRAKWDASSFGYRHTPRSFAFAPGDDALLGELGELALSCWRLFELGGHARVDFRVDASGRPWVLEVNANPCLAPDAGFPAAAARAGLELDAVVDRLITDARRADHTNGSPLQCSASAACSTTP